MSEPNHPLVQPGQITVISSGMFGGKTTELVDRLMPFDYIPGYKGAILAVKPDKDTRNPGVIKGRSEKEVPCKMVDSYNPYKILELLRPEHKMLVIDEGQFFGRGLANVVEEVALKNVQVIVAALDSCYRGVSFQEISRLLVMAPEVLKPTRAVCYKSICGQVGRRTQKLVDGKPAPWSTRQEDIFVPEGTTTNLDYKAACIQHHEVPGRPKHIGSLTVVLEKPESFRN